MGDLAKPSDPSRSDSVRSTIREAMDEVPALGRPGLLSKLTNLLDAERSVFATKDGAITDERSVPDNSARLRALNMAFSLRDEYPHHAVGVNVGIAIAMERLPDLSQLSVRELSKLAGIDDDSVAEAEVVESERAAS